MMEKKMAKKRRLTKLEKAILAHVDAADDCPQLAFIETYAIVSDDDNGTVTIRCPYCGEEMDESECDVIGADEDCCFCAACQEEMRYPD